MMKQPSKHEIDEMINWIKGATYEELLRQWRFAPAGAPMFCHKEVYDFFVDRFKAQKRKVGHDAVVAASKRVGWRYQ